MYEVMDVHPIVAALCSRAINAEAWEMAAEVWSWARLSPAQQNQPPSHPIAAGPAPS